MNSRNQCLFVQHDERNVDEKGKWATVGGGADGEENHPSTSTSRCEFGGRRASPIKMCQDIVKILNEIRTVQDHACVSGDQVSAEKRLHESLTIIHDCVQTKKNCESWFAGGCKNKRNESVEPRVYEKLSS